MVWMRLWLLRVTSEANADAALDVTAPIRLTAERGDDVADRGSPQRLLVLPGGHVCVRAEADTETGSFDYQACVVS